MQFATTDSKGVIGGINWTDSNNDNLRLMIHPTQAYVLKVDLYDEEQDNIAGTAAGFASSFLAGVAALDGVTGFCSCFFAGVSTFSVM